MLNFDIPQLRADFSFSTPIQLRFSDIDGYLHVNNGVYFSYFEHARAVFLYLQAGWDVLDVGTVVGRIEIDYIRPIHLQDQVEALVKCSRLGNSSFDLEQVLLGRDSAGKEYVFATCKSVLVSVDKNSMKPVSIPDAYRQKLASS
ncbi:MAG: thioesterase family protein [Bacteroidetes bacterium]|nr:thioesterase family protein [Bacteroidota bacterium]MDA1267939.1 thioesterase family protein [Bacteroidota bacterium]